MSVLQGAHFVLSGFLVGPPFSEVSGHEFFRSSYLANLAAFCDMGAFGLTEQGFGLLGDKRVGG